MRKLCGWALVLAVLAIWPVAAQSDEAGYHQSAGTVAAVTATELTVQWEDGTQTTWPRAQLREADAHSGSWGTPLAWRSGDEVKVFTKAGQVQADPIAVKLTDAVYGVDADYFGRDGVSANDRLLINGLARTQVSDTDGREMPKEAVLDNDLLVLYTIATRSLPPQTVPDKVIVLSQTAAQVQAVAKAAAAPAPQVKGAASVNEAAQDAATQGAVTTKDAVTQDAATTKDAVTQGAATQGAVTTQDAATAAKRAGGILPTGDVGDAMPSLGAGITVDAVTVYPVREVLTKWGAQVGWDAAAQAVMIDWLGHAYRLSIPDSTLQIDGQPTYRVAAVQLADGVAYADRAVLAALWQLGQLDR